MTNEDKNNSAQNLLVSNESEPSVFRRVESHVQSKTLSGLIELVPVLISIVLILFIVNWADSIVRPLPFVSGRTWDFPGIGLVIGIVVFYLLGVLLPTWAGKFLVTVKDLIFSHIPVVSTVFGVAQIATTSATSQFRFTRVVFVEWTQPGVVSLGFVTGQAFRDSGKAGNNDGDEAQSLAVVYLPTAPNPTAGNLAVIVEDDLIETDITVEDAMKLVFSGGIVLPESIAMARLPRVQREGEMLDRFTVNAR